jgi:exopolysaccharide biosynthesis polyprenyl glycosylphosphotransferase
MLRTPDLRSNINYTLSTSTRKLPLGFSERKVILRASDMILIGVGIVSALSYATHQSQQELTWQLCIGQAPWMVLMAIGWLLWLFINGLYELPVAAKLQRNVQRIFCGGALISVLWTIYYFLTTQTFIEASATLPFPLAPAIAVLNTTVLLSVWRTSYSLLLVGSHAKQRVVIIGAGKTGQKIAQVLQKDPHYQTLGFIDDNEKLHGQRYCNLPVLGDRQLLSSTLDRHNVDEIVLAISGSIDNELLQRSIDCHEQGITITLMPVLYEHLTGKVAVEDIGSQWYTALPLTKHPFETFNSVGKRLIDLTCGLIIGAVLAIVFPFVAIAIKLNSPGPIFYKQERVGLNGKKFTVCKFRSMVQNAEVNGKAQWAVKGDSRITKVGHFLRKTRLDELPQVLNVLSGDMSMVGPRPEREQFIEQLQQQLPFYRTRLAAKPGLTGWAQVNYGYGSTVEDALIKLQYDLYYLKRWTPWLDLKILVKTVEVVVKMQGQ